MTQSRKLTVRGITALCTCAGVLLSGCKSTRLSESADDQTPLALESSRQIKLLAILESLDASTHVTLPACNAESGHAILFVLVRGQFLEGWPVAKPGSGKSVFPYKWSVRPRSNSELLLVSKTYKADYTHAPFWLQPWTTYEFWLELPQSETSQVAISWHRRGDPLPEPNSLTPREQAPEILPEPVTEAMP